ncbi:MAG TPA: GNAT family N-acetyltransferase [Candidatus Polarisedimenticolia bacterium]|nr:GNAT family N-acetyltransferase [Candidatus Polarisedimenticolia bacterium]
MSQPRPQEAAASIRMMHAGDRPGLLAILEATRAFHPAEIQVALELIDFALERPGQTDYHFRCLDLGGRLAGYMCYGQVPLSDRCWDLYWIAVDPALHGRGLGRSLIACMEEDLRERRARKILIETGGKSSYGPTRRFYESAGYAEIARIPGFFAPGDDKVIFGKDLA